MSVSSFIKNLFGLNDEAKYFILKTKGLIAILKISPLDSALTVETFYTLTKNLLLGRTDRLAYGILRDAETPRL